MPRPIPKLLERTRGRLIEGLANSDTKEHRRYRAALRASSGTAHFIKEAGRFPLAGHGNIATHAVFLELAASIVIPSTEGRLGLLVPSGLATQDSQKELVSYIVEGRLRSLFDFENSDGLFPAVHRSFRFAIVVASACPEKLPARFSFFLRNIAELSEPDRVLGISVELFSPKGRAPKCPPGGGCSGGRRAGAQAAGVPSRRRVCAAHARARALRRSGGQRRSGTVGAQLC